MLELHLRRDAIAQGGEYATVCDQRVAEVLNAVGDEVCEFWVYVLSKIVVRRVERVDQYGDLRRVHRVSAKLPRDVLLEVNEPILDTEFVKIDLVDKV